MQAQFRRGVKFRAAGRRLVPMIRGEPTIHEVSLEFRGTRTCSAPVLQSLHRRRYRFMRRTVVVQFTCESDAARVVPLGATATKREHHPIPALTYA
jgi:hypothetical protein